MRFVCASEFDRILVLLCQQNQWYCSYFLYTASRFVSIVFDAVIVYGELLVHLAKLYLSSELLVDSWYCHCWSSSMVGRLHVYCCMFHCWPIRGIGIRIFSQTQQLRLTASRQIWSCVHTRVLPLLNSTNRGHNAFYGHWTQTWTNTQPDPTVENHSTGRTHNPVPISWIRDGMAIDLLI